MEIELKVYTAKIIISAKYTITVDGSQTTSEPFKIYTVLTCGCGFSAENL